MPDVPGLKPESIEAIKAGNADTMRKGIAKTWMELHPNEDRPMAVDGARWRHSWAAKCDRQTRYLIEDRPPSNPIGIDSLWNFRLGQLIHDDVQATLEAMIPDTTIEVSLPSPDVDGACSLDAVINYEDATQAVEIKSIGGFGFKKMIGAATSKEGPRWSSVVQLAMNAHALNQEHDSPCLGGWLVVFAKENVSVTLAEREGLSKSEQFIKTYYYAQDALEAVAFNEIARVQRILHQHDGEVVTPRSIPDPDIPEGALITDPNTGAWEVRIGDHGEQLLDTGKTWHCAYCDFQATCIEEGP